MEKILTLASYEDLDERTSTILIQLFIYFRSKGGKREKQERELKTFAADNKISFNPVLHLNIKNLTTIKSDEPFIGHFSMFSGTRKYMT